MGVKIKICGLKSLEDVSYANQCMPDYVGFVFAQSKRQVKKDLAVNMRAELNDKIPVVGVFVRERISFISDLCKEGVVQMVQLHGEEDVSYIQELKQEVDVPILYALRVKNQKTIPVAKGLPVDYLLLDSYVKGQYGGSGTTFDISWIPQEWNQPYFLAGGINSDNIKEILNHCHPFCIDISSGVETEGKKDFKKMEYVVNMLKNI